MLDIWETTCRDFYRGRKGERSNLTYKKKFKESSFFVVLFG
jgi:hypothetical protein